MAGDLTLAQAEAALGEPAARWEMRCYEIASRLVHARAVEGKAVYGHWRGPVHPAAPFTSVVVVRHGWINLPDGRICDPTRWVFEQVRPYIYTGPNDHYDEGGDVLRRLVERPAPERNYLNPAERTYDLRLPDDVEWWLPGSSAAKGLRLPRKSWEQCHWLATLSRATLGEHAPFVYTALIEAGLAALIPLDNLRAVLPEKARRNT